MQLGQKTHQQRRLPVADSPFSYRQPGSATGYVSPTQLQGSVSWAEGDHLPHGLILRMRTIPSSRPLPTLESTSERRGIPGVQEMGRNRVGVTADV